MKQISPYPACAFEYGDSYSCGLTGFSSCKFFQSEDNCKGKQKQGAWQMLYKPIAEGGIGVRDMGEIKRSLRMKFFWQLLTEK